MENCMKCGAELAENAIYCHLCGKKQLAEKRKALKRANGTGTVYKLSGRRKKPWVAAKNKVVIGYYERKTDALDALERLNGKSLTDRYNMTFAEVFDAWKEEHYKEIGKQGLIPITRLTRYLLHCIAESSVTFAPQTFRPHLTRT